MADLEKQEKDFSLTFFTELSKSSSKILITMIRLIYK